MNLGYLFAKGLRLGGSIYLIFLAIKLIRLYREKRSTELGIILAFAAALLGYLLAPFPFHFKELQYLAFPLLFGAWAAPYTIYLMAGIFFEEDYKITKKHFGFLLALEALQFYLFYSSINPLPHWLYENNSTLSLMVHIVLPRMIGALLALAAIYKVYRVKISDQNEVKRKKRNQFVAFTSFLTLIVVGSETWGYIFGHSNFVEALTTALCIYLIYQVTEESLRPNSFWTKTSNIKQKSTKDLAAEINELFQNEKVYLSSKLNIRSLAKKIKAPEYRVRETIQSEFGFQHFKSFLNHYRIEEAKKLLQTPDVQETSIYNLAQDVGFGSLASFNRVFKESVGIPPTEFRKSQNL